MYDCFLPSSELLNKIKDPDIVIGDSLFGMCTTLLSEKLRVRRIDINMASFGHPLHTCTAFPNLRLTVLRASAPTPLRCHSYNVS